MMLFGQVIWIPIIYLFGNYYQYRTYAFCGISAFPEVIFAAAVYWWSCFCLPWCSMASGPYLFVGSRNRSMVDTIWAVVLPTAVNAANIIVARTSSVRQFPRTAGGGAGRMMFWFQVFHKDCYSAVHAHYSSALSVGGSCALVLTDTSILWFISTPRRNIRCSWFFEESADVSGGFR